MAFAHGGSLGERICRAIEQRRLIEVTYHGRLRVAEPHDYGRRGGRDRLLIYQIRATGGSDRSAVGWRLLDISDIESLIVLDETFPGSRGASHRDHKAWDEVYARVA